MKKSLLALAVLGAFAGTASAQSSVTLYGTIDMGLVRQSSLKDWRFDTGTGDSQLGFRGVEDLGGGTSAIFDLRHRFSPESGGMDGSSNGRPFWQSASWVGLQGGFGKIRVGRQLTAFQDPVGLSDPFATLEQGSVHVLPTGFSADPKATKTQDGAGLGRTDVLSYYTPSMGGFGVAVSVAPKRTADTGTGTTHSNAFFSLWGSYAAGPVYVGLGTEKNRDGDKIVAGLATVDFGVVKVMGGLAQVDAVSDHKSLVPAQNSFNGTVTNTPAALVGPDTILNGKKGQNMNFGLVAPVGPFVLKFGYGRVKNETALGVAQVVNQQRVSVGADYILSKRTKLYTSYKRDNKTTVATDKKGLDFGLTHDF